MSVERLDDLPGFRRRFRILSEPGVVRSDVEDDIHCMGVIVRHDGAVATAVEPVMVRVPWTTCPGAVAQLRETFTGVALDKFASRGEKSLNCTHLHDLAILAAAYFRESGELIFDLLVTDPVDGRSTAELRRNSEPVLRWTYKDSRIEQPEDMAGVSLFDMRAWLASLSGPELEAARMLRWGTMLAHGRVIPPEKQSDASVYTGNCYSFQPGTVENARRVGELRDFSNGTAMLFDRGAPTDEIRPENPISSESDAKKDPRRQS